MFKVNFFTILILSSLLFGSCKKDTKVEPVTPPPEPVLTAASVSFNFKALMDNLPLVANTKWYKNANADSFTVTKFNYYVSSISLKRDDGFIFSENYSYHIIKHVEGITSFSITDLPDGNYDQIEFTIGVDSLHNISGTQAGALSPDTMMYWGWSSGYIFFKLEGFYRTPNSMPGASFAMHVGFPGNNGNLRKNTFNLSNKITAAKGKQSKVFFNTSVNEIFANPNTISLDTYYVIAGSHQAQILADNYKDMLVIDHIEN